MSNDNKNKYEDLKGQLRREYELLACAEESLKNEERETKEIKRFVREVVKIKPLPTFNFIFLSQPVS
ncbi:hypothetical protein DES36_11476 [Alkalibaculum bacchi]|jgi:hypothetical protein|uniref:Uncharacterized protein n=1 Tax=Alkalibaculum bacchi TaxID=645887 RepID=A0A366I1W0_9FIRM|nr:hypothetical protein [Alkalibaculum bacchi]RBP61392.1 hypothetical protein DES36_11476 [Alkalibaculum bacchi]